MIALIWFLLAVLASTLKSKSQLEAENAVLRHQLIVLRRKLKGRRIAKETTIAMHRIVAIAGAFEAVRHWRRVS
jgi:hypothetical protein